MPKGLPKIALDGLHETEALLHFGIEVVTVLYRGYIGIMENEMETTIL